MKNNQKGITLVALVITIIVLLILAGVTIAALSGDNGILTNASKSQQENAIGNAKDQVAMAINEATNAYYNATYLNDTTGSGSKVVQGEQDKTAVNYIIAITDANDATIKVFNNGGTYTVQIKTTDKNPRWEVATITEKGGLGSWSSASADATGTEVTTNLTAATP